MHVDDLILISVDDHLIEPPDLFDHHLPSKFRDRAPKIVRNEAGDDVWVFGDAVIANVALNAVVGRPKDEYGTDPTCWDEMRPGCYDVDERVKDMNAAGVLAQMNFPSFPGFCGRLFAESPDKVLAKAVVEAYNDFIIDQWCGAYPDRFIPMAIPMMWDAELSAAEVRRVAAKGCHSLSFTENPYTLGYPSYHDEYWDPLWKAVCDTNTVVSVHLGSSGKLVMTAPDAPFEVMSTLMPMNISVAAADILWSRPVREFPDIRFALTEGGTGWIPYFLERIDRVYDQNHAWTGNRFAGKLPSEVFREHFLTCFIVDSVGVDLRHRIGIDNICWELDYPHGDTEWPRPGEVLLEATAGVPDDELHRMTHENAMRWYSFDPFSIRPKERCTVAALRAESPGRDVEIRSVLKRRPKMTGGARAEDWQPTT